MKYCGNCGNMMQDMDNVCSQCGTMVDNNIRAYRPSERVNKPSNNQAIIGLILGVSAIFFFWIPVVPVIASVIGIVLSIIGIKGADNGKSGKGIAIGGLVCSILALSISGLMTSCYMCYGCAICGTSNSSWI